MTLTALLSLNCAARASLADRLDALLPQTQCTRCGYPDCRRYAEAIAEGAATINRCPPGGVDGIARLALASGQPALPLDPACGREGPRLLAVIDEAWCIGCTLCIKACPVDCILGASKAMHTVIDDQCTGCELCVPVCPVDCISLLPVTGERTGWQAWSPAQADDALVRYRATQQRRERDQREHDDRLATQAAAQRVDLPADLPPDRRHADPSALDRKRTLIEAAMAGARARRDAEGSP